MPPKPAHIYTTPDGTRIGATGNAVYVSTDQGDTWELVHGDEPKDEEAP